jgi:hypothetical protein
MMIKGTCIVIHELQREITRYSRTWDPYNPGAVYARWTPVELTDYFPTPLTWESFKIGTGGYEDLVPTEAYCPCGATVQLGDDDHCLGDFVEAAQAHIEEKHQRAAS